MYIYILDEASYKQAINLAVDRFFLLLHTDT